jgi:hypothetical protein
MYQVNLFKGSHHRLRGHHEGRSPVTIEFERSRDESLKANETEPTQTGGRKPTRT